MAKKNLLYPGLTRPGSMHIMSSAGRAGGTGRRTGLKILWTRVRAGSSPALGTMKALGIAGWSSQAARRAHNPKVAGSNPAPATNSAAV